MRISVSPDLAGGSIRDSTEKCNHAEKLMDGRVLPEWLRLDWNCPCLGIMEIQYSPRKTFQARCEKCWLSCRQTRDNVGKLSRPWRQHNSSTKCAKLVPQRTWRFRRSGWRWKIKRTALRPSQAPINIPLPLATPITLIIFYKRHCKMSTSLAS